MLQTVSRKACSTLRRIGIVFVLSSSLLGTAAFAQAPVTLLALGGEQVADMSADGRWVVFLGGANIYLGDTERPGATTLISHSASSTQTPCTGQSARPAISRDGNLIAYESDCTDLMAGQTGLQSSNVFLFDRRTGTNTLVSHQAGLPAVTLGLTSSTAAISMDGRFVAYTSFSFFWGGGQILLYDRTTGENTLVSHRAGDLASANSTSDSASISDDGRFVVYESEATDLVAGNSGPAPFNYNAYLFDRQTGANTLVSHAAGSPLTWSGGVFPKISADGNFVFYGSAGADLVPGEVLATANGGGNAFLWDRVADWTTLISHRDGLSNTTGNFGSGPLGLSADGSFLLWVSNAGDLLPGSTSSSYDHALFLTDHSTGSTTLLSRPYNMPTIGITVPYGAARISADGKSVTFTTYSIYEIVQGVDTPNADIYLYNRVAGVTTLLSHVPGSTTQGGNDSSGGLNGLAISADGGKVAFFSAATDLIPFNFGSVNIYFATNALAGGRLFTLSPCRLFDSRQGSPLTSGVVTNLTVHGACGIPATARAIAANVTVLQGTGPGYVTLYPGDLAAPLASTLNFAAGQTRSNNAILPLSLNGLGRLALGAALPQKGTVQVIVDVFGYFE